LNPEIDNEDWRGRFSDAVSDLSCGSVNTRSRDERLLCPSGRAVLAVRNSDSEVGIVEGRSGSGARTVIAVVSQGSHEVQIRNSWAYYYFARRQSDGRHVSHISGRRGSVELQRECRN
jgi:hypothetical protein